MNDDVFLPPVGPESVRVVCPFCHARIRTQVQHKASTRTHLLAVLLLIFCCLPCLFIPYCIKSCKNVHHYCPNCGAFLGTYNS